AAHRRRPRRAGAPRPSGCACPRRGPGVSAAAGGPVPGRGLKAPGRPPRAGSAVITARTGKAGHGPHPRKLCVEQDFSIDGEKSLVVGQIFISGRAKRLAVGQNFINGREKSLVRGENFTAAGEKASPMDKISSRSGK